MSCVTKKNGYYSEEEVQEALVRSQIRFSLGAINYYLCNDCNEYHLTSQGVKHTLLSDPDVIIRIERERRTQEWEGRLRR